MGELDVLKLRNRVAALLAPWDRPDSPGASVGVVRDGALVVQASAGTGTADAVAQAAAWPPLGRSRAPETAVVPGAPTGAWHPGGRRVARGRAAGQSTTGKSACGV